jgi:paraquat-inducible protein A
MRAGAAPRIAPETVACPDCDLLQDLPILQAGERACCARCAHVLAMAPRRAPELPLALTLAAAIVFIIANVTPLMGLSVLGRSASTTIIGGAWAMWENGEPLTAAIVAFCAVLAPGMYIAFMLIVLLAARRERVPHWVGELLRWAEFSQPWAMVEVMMLGILVALIKIAELAAVAPDVGMYAVGALVLLFPAIAVSFDPRQVWKRVCPGGGDSPKGPEAPGASEALP